MKGMNKILIAQVINKRFLAVICIIKEQDFDRPFLIDYNIEIFRKGKYISFLNIDIGDRTE